MFAIFREKREDAHAITHPLKHLTSNNQTEPLKSAATYKQEKWFLIDYGLVSLSNGWFLVFQNKFPSIQTTAGTGPSCRAQSVCRRVCLC